MIFIIGAACSGKTEYAKSIASKDAVIIDDVHMRLKEMIMDDDGANEAMMDLDEHAIVAKIIAQVEEQIQLQSIWQNQNQATNQQMISQTDERVIIVGLEMGCGVVPMDKMERMYREINGRLNCQLAQLADEAYLMECGIPLKIK